MAMFDIKKGWKRAAAKDDDEAREADPDTRPETARTVPRLTNDV
jgi:hypothetical protein